MHIGLTIFFINQLFLGGRKNIINKKGRTLGTTVTIINKGFDTSAHSSCAQFLYLHIEFSLYCNCHHKLSSGNLDENLEK